MNRFAPKETLSDQDLVKSYVKVRHTDARDLRTVFFLPSGPLAKNQAPPLFNARLEIQRHFGNMEGKRPQTAKMLRKIKASRPEQC